MSDNDNLTIISGSGTKGTPAKARRSFLRQILAVIAILTLVAVVAGKALWAPLVERGRAFSNATPQSQAGSGTALELKVEALEQRVNALELHQATEAQGVLAQPSSAPAIEKVSPAVADVARMQTDLVSVSAALTAVQAEMKRIGSAAAETREHERVALAESLALMQLEVVANAGHPFTSELASLQTAAKSDIGFQDPLVKLAPYAEKGVPSIPALHEELLDDMSRAEHAIEKAEAQGWWDKILVELKGLVSIRPLHGGTAADTSLDVMQTALANDDVATALGEMDRLPPQGKDSLKDWRQGAEGRLAVDQALHDLSSHLIAGASASSASQDAP